MNRTFILSTVCGAILIAAVPWGLLYMLNHGSLQVPPELRDDSGYYYARMESVGHGHPLIGNPYFKEYSGEIAPAFFGADWLAAVPLMFGVPLIPAIVGNTLLWIGVFAFLAWILFSLLGMRGWWAVGGVASVYASSFWLLERPVSMQIVFPCFIFFLIAYLCWLRAPSSRLITMALALATALSFYIYSFFWQITLVTIVLSHILFFTHHRRRFLSLLIIDGLVGILAIPFVWVSALQITNPWYWETMARIGLVETHTFGSAAITSGVIIAVFLFALSLLARDRIARSTYAFLYITGIALIVCSFSNVITGKDVETGTHIGQFVTLWATLIAAYGVYLFFTLSQREGFSKKRLLFLKKGVVCMFGLFILWYSYQMVLPFFRINSTFLISQAYGAPLDWLQIHAPPGSVIFSDDSFSYYVPILTKDYVLFQPDGGLQLMPSQEVADRYLTSRMFAHLTLADIESDYRLYAGAGNAVDQYKTANKDILWCKIFLQKNCGSLFTNGASFKGESYFEGLYQNYTQDIEVHPESSLRRFGVNYIVKDTLLDPTFHPEKLSGAQLVATVGRFQIYAFH